MIEDFGQKVRLEPEPWMSRTRAFPDTAQTLYHNNQWTHLDLNLCKYFRNSWYHKLTHIQSVDGHDLKHSLEEGRIFAMKKKTIKHQKWTNLWREKSIPNGHWVGLREVGWQAGAKPDQHLYLYFLYLVVAFVFLCICLCSGLVKTASPTSAMQC